MLIQRNTWLDEIYGSDMWYDAARQMRGRYIRRDEWNLLAKCAPSQRRTEAADSPEAAVAEHNSSLCRHARLTNDVLKLQDRRAGFRDSA